MVYIPLGAKGSETYNMLRDASPLSSQFVFTDVIKTIIQFPNLSEATPADLLSQGTGTPAITELNSSEICGCLMDADSESYGHLYIPEQDLDPSQAIGFRCLWSNSAAAATGSAQFSVVYKHLVAGTTAFAIGATALDTVIADQVDKAANVQQWTDWGVTTAAVFAALGFVPADDQLAIKVAVNLTTISDATLLAVQIKYRRRYIN